MTYTFSKEKFIKNAPTNIKNRLKHLVDDFENLVVDFSEDKINGTVNIILNGVVNELYPVNTEWCNKEEQLRLI